MDENKLYFGLKNVKYAVRDGVDETGAPKWKPPLPLPGAVGLSPKVEGDSTPFYADDVIYYISESNSGYTGDLEIAKAPDAFLVDALGWAMDANGMLVEIADGIKQEFALMGQITGDKKPRKFIYYCCTTARPEKESNTKSDKGDPDTTTLGLTMLPMQVEDKLITKAKIELNDSNQEAYDSFFSQVKLPDFTTIPVTGITLNKPSTSIVVGSNETLVTAIAPANATDQVVNWVSSDPTKATVDSTGKVTAVAAGTTTIVATAHGDSSKVATCVVTVIAS